MDILREKSPVWDSHLLSAVRVCDMRTGITVTVSPADHDRLSGIVSDGNSPQKHVWRAEIVLLTAEGEGTSAIMSVTGKSKTAVWRWQERFMREGVEGLLHDKTRPRGRRR